MTNKIGMNVEAIFDPNGVNRGLQQVEQKINQVNRNPVNPVSDKSIKQLDELNKRFQQLLKVDGELRRRVKATGQEGKLFEDIDWGSTHPDKNARSKKLNSINEYLGGGRGGGGGSGPHPPPPENKSGALKQIAVGAAQSGLRAAGPAGGVAASALGTGMSAGAGAGLMGLIGGIVALGVGKVVGGIMEKVGQAEDNNVAFDKLKRTLGDVNVSFAGLKSVVMDGADNLKITYGDFTQLSSQFVKGGNVKDREFTSLPDEIGVGVGMSRSFGLDPSQGVGLMAQMRGIGVTSNVQDSRRFALLIGETIGKSGAFAKADEVMEAIGTYAQTQTRATLGNANVGGYAGMFSGMVGSGIPGLDPSGAGAILSRVNAALSQGGAKGEASQFFTARLGQKRGMDTFDTQLWREGGAFSTADSTFGGNGAVGKFYDKYGLNKPGGNQSLLSANLEQLKSDYGNDPKMMLQATANQMGLSMSQAAAFHVVDPNKMGEMENYAGDLTKLSASGIGNLSKVVTGDSADRRAVAENLSQRNILVGKDEEDYNKAVESNDVGTQKEILGRLVASNDQERTTGTDIRDSKNALDNIKTSLADKLVPLTLEMRHGIMSIAGGGKKSSEEILKGVVEVDSAARTKSIHAKFGDKNMALTERQYQIQHKLGTDLNEDKLRVFYKNKPEEYAAKLKERTELMAEASEIDKKIGALVEEKAGLLKKENERKAKELSAIDDGLEARRKIDEEAAKIRDTPKPNYSNSRSSAGNFNSSVIDAKLADAEGRNNLPAGVLKSVIQQETGGSSAYMNDPSKYHYPLNADGKRIAGHTGKVSTAFGPFGILESTAAKPGYGVSPLKDKSIDEQIRFAGDYLGARSKSAGSVAGGLAGYGEGIGYSNSVMSRVGRAGTPMPADAGAGRGEDPQKFTMQAEPIVILHQNAKGEEVQRPQFLNTKFMAANPFGGGR